MQPGPFWQENLDFFQTHDPSFVAEVEAAPESDALDIRHLDNGLPVAYWDNRWIDPPEAPQTQALQVVGQHQDPVHLHLGLGLGYYLEVDQAGPDTTIIVYEPKPEIAKAAMHQRPLAKICQRKQAFITCNFKQLEKLLIMYLTFGKGVKVVVSPGHERLFPEQLAHVTEVYNKVHEIRRLARGMLGEAVGGTWAATFKALQYTSKLPGVETLRGKLESCPIVIVSAGPSLKTQLPFIKAYRDRLLIMAISRTAKLLESHGIAPDFLVHVEAQDYFDLIRDCSNLDQTIFLLADQSQAHYYRFPHQRTLVYQSSQNPITQWANAREPKLTKMNALNSGSVSSIAFHLAAEMGCSPIMVTGQDLAFRDNQLYADGGKADEVFAQRRMRQVDGLFDEKLTTSNNYLVTIYWYEKIIPELRKRFPDLELFNISTSGAALPHFSHRSLQQIMAKHSQNLTGTRQNLHGADLSAPDISQDLIQNLINQLEKDLRYIGKHSKQYEAFARPFLKKLAKAKKPKDFQNLQNQMKKLDAINNSLFVYFDKNPGVPAFFQAQVEQFRSIQQAIQQRSGGQQGPQAWREYMKQNLTDLTQFYQSLQKQADHIGNLATA
jgi:hypothetical protein